jgi:hypothetical protein
MICKYVIVLKSVAIQKIRHHQNPQYPLLAVNGVKLKDT